MAAAAATFVFWSTAGPALFPDALEAFAEGLAGLDDYHAYGAGAAAAAAAAAAGAEPALPSSLLLAVKLAVDVLVVACPCALGLATPTAVLVGSSLGARRGLLLRGGDVLERIAGVDTVVFDKTGTLTGGRLRLTGLAAASGVSADELLALAAAVESATRHPLADAVADAAAARKLPLPAVEGASTTPGAGAAGTVGGQRVAVGRRDWVLSQVGAPAGSGPELAPAPLDGGTPGAGCSDADTRVYVGRGGALLGALSFTDVLRPDAAATVARLQGLGFTAHVLSGDSPSAVAAIARLAGVDPARARGGLGPQAKLEAVRALQAGGARVLFVGDGVNDAPALAAADVGVAMGGGLDAAGASRRRACPSLLRVPSSLSHAHRASLLPSLLLRRRRRRCAPSFSRSLLSRAFPQARRPRWSSWATAWGRWATASPWAAPRCPRSAKTWCGRCFTTSSASRWRPASCCRASASRSTPARRRA
jgi:Cu2+-exporting ATPase